MIKQIYQKWKERRKARIEECRNWMPEPYRITPEELEEINQLLEEMDKMEQRGGRGSTRRKRVKGAVRRQGEARPLTLREPTRLLPG